MAADALTVLPSRCIVVEDSPSGIEAARRADMRSIAVGPAHASLPATLACQALSISPPRRLRGSWLTDLQRPPIERWQLSSERFAAKFPRQSPTKRVSGRPAR